MREELSTEWRDLRQRLGNLICRIDGQTASLSAKEKRMEELLDESYWKGVQDLYEAVVAAIEDDGMTLNDMRKYFGTYYAVDAISKNDPKTIMEKVNEWKADKEHVQKEEKEFQVGDEVVAKEYWMPTTPEKGIITAINHEYLYIVWPGCANGDLLISNTYAEHYKKTGRHFDSIPFSYGLSYGQEE